MPLWGQLPERPRSRVSGSLLVVAIVVAFAVNLRRRFGASSKFCHPNLSQLHAESGSSLLLVATVPLDLAGSSERLVRDALRSWKPDVVVVEGGPAAGVNALLLSGRWEFDGQGQVTTRRPNSSSASIADGLLVRGPSLVRRWPWQRRVPRRVGASLRSGALPATAGSEVPVQVGRWAQRLSRSVGGGTSAAASSAAAMGVPLRFLGAANSGFQGNVQVSSLAQQAARELLDQELQRGSQLPASDIVDALGRADVRVRQDASQWNRDVRGQTTRRSAQVSARSSRRVRDRVSRQLEERAAADAEGIVRAMRIYKRAAVIVTAELFAAVEDRLKNAGYEFVSGCA